MISLAQLHSRVVRIGKSHELINSGGCGCMAVMLAKALKDKVNALKIKTCGDWGMMDDYNNIDVIREAMSDPYDKENWEDFGVGFYHVWVEFELEGKWYAIDSTGVYKITESNSLYSRWGKPTEGSFHIEEMEALADSTSWNFMFERSQLPSMRRMVKQLIETL